MDDPATHFVCGGCGRTVGDGELPFYCAGERTGDDIDHVLVRREREPGTLRFPPRAELVDDNPFVRYRRLLHPYHVAVAGGLDDDDYLALVRRLDDGIARVEGREHGFRVTPFGFRPHLQAMVKDETDNVAGSHKGRHLMGILIYLEVLEALGRVRPVGKPLAIASCGNAALAAAVLARAAKRPLRVFVPVDAHPWVMERLALLGAEVEQCPRRAGERGDPAYFRFREEVAAHAVLPFTCQGPDCGLTIDGGRTLGYEIVEALGQEQRRLDDLFVQVGGGALGSALSQSLDEAVRLGVIPWSPRMTFVQTSGVWPLARAWWALERTMREQGSAAVEERLAEAAHHRSRYMWPWPQTPASVAHGILDDETYDWWALVAAMARTGGRAVVVDEETLLEANQLANEHRGEAPEVDETGSAGLAGLIRDRRAGLLEDGREVAVIFSGARRGNPETNQPLAMPRPEAWRDIGT